MSFKVEIEYESEEEFVLQWCQAIRARTAWKKGVDKENHTLETYGASWMDCILDDLSRRLPEDLKPDGSETGKP